MALIQKAFSDIITFSRSSNATRVGPTGLVEYAPHNLLLQSQTFDNASWTKGNSSVTANAIAAPDGTVTADKLVENSSAATHQVAQGVSVTSGIPYTVSIYVKAGERTKFQVNTNLISAGFVYITAKFDISAGTVISVDAGLTASIQSVGNGWYRCIVTGTAGATTSKDFIFNLLDASGTASYTGDGTSGIYLWGAQLSVGPYALDYTPTTSAAVYGPRFDYDPVTLAARGLLVEEQRTNNFTYSQLFSNAAWLKDRASVTLSGTAPDGTATSFELIEDSTAANDHYIKYAASSFSAATWTLSVFAKKNTRSAIALRFLTAVNSYATVVFNLETGLETKRQSDGGFSAISATSTAFGNGWYRLTLTATASGGFDASILISNSTAPTIGTFGQVAYNGDGSSGLLIWGAQMENGAFASSYIPTLASTVTRSADVASVNTLSPWFNATEGTLFVESNGQSATSYGRIADLTDSTNTNSIRVYQDTSASPVRLGFTTSIGASQDFNIIPAVNVGTAVARIAGAYALNSTQAAVNGTLGIEDTACNVATGLDRLMLGRSATGGSLFVGHIRRIAYYPRRLTNAELQALTA